MNELRRPDPTVISTVARLGDLIVCLVNDSSSDVKRGRATILRAGDWGRTRSARSKSKNTTAEVIRPPSTIVNATRIA